MKSLLKLGLIILVIVMCFRFCSSCASEAGKAGGEIVSGILDTEVTTEISDDPMDKLYGVNQEAETFTLKEKLNDGAAKIKETFKTEE